MELIISCTERRDGFDRKDFHRSCDNQSPRITILCLINLILSMIDIHFDFLFLPGHLSDIDQSIGIAIIVSGMLRTPVEDLIVVQISFFVHIQIK